MADNSFKVKNGLNIAPKDPATLVNPKAGDIIVDSTDNNKLKTYNANSGNFDEIKGATAVINYIENSDLESDALGYSTYADAAGENAVDGTGGTPNITFARNTSSPLRGLADGLLTKDAVNRQGEGLSYDFTIEDADLASKLTISFDYQTGVGYNDGDIRVQIYDVTNDRLIRINGEELKASALPNTHIARFQASSNSTSYRLILHVSSTNATGYSVNLDNVFVGPQKIAYGVPVTDWEEFTPTGTWTTNTNYVGEYRRVGDSAEIQVSVNITGTPGPATPLAIYFDNINIEIDESKLATSQANEATVGSGLVSGNFSYGVDVVAQVGSGLTSRVLIKDSSTAGNSNVNTTSPKTFGANDTIQITFSVPIQGWSSNAKMSEDLGGRDVVTVLKDTLTQTVSSGTVTKVAFSATSVEKDTVAAFNDTVDEINILQSGYYDIKANVAFGANNTGRRLVAIQKAGVSIPTGITVQAPTPANTHIQDAVLLGEYLEKGDKLNIVCFQDTGGNLDISSQGFSVVKRSSPQTTFDSETVAARYTNDNGQAIGTSATDVIFNILSYDTHNAYNTSTGLYTAPVSGYYQVSSSTTASADGGSLLYYIVVNGSTYSRVTNRDTASNTGVVTSDIVYLNKGDLLQMKLQAGTSTTLVTDATRNFFSIARIK